MELTPYTVEKKKVGDGTLVNDLAVQAQAQAAKEEAAKGGVGHLCKAPIYGNYYRGWLSMHFVDTPYCKVGTYWICDVCGTQWKAVRVFTGQWYWKRRLFHRKWIKE